MVLATRSQNYLSYNAVVQFCYYLESTPLNHRYFHTLITKFLVEERREIGGIDNYYLLVMESVNATKGRRENQQDHQSSRRRRKLSFIITSVVIFSLIIALIITVLSILQHDTEAEGLSANPTKAIRVVCSLTPHPSPCSKSLMENLNIYPSKSNTINPSKIFTLSLHAAMDKVGDLISTVKAGILKAKKDSTTLTALKRCRSLLEDSMKLVNNTMELMGQFDPEENAFTEDKFLIKALPGWMTNATENIERCLTEVELINGWSNNSTSGEDKDDWTIRRDIKTEITRFSRPSMENSLMILVKMEEILELFDPRFGSVLASLLLEARGYVFIAGVFCSQYLFLIILIVLVLRSY